LDALFERELEVVTMIRRKLFCALTLAVVGGANSACLLDSGPLSSGGSGGSGSTSSVGGSGGSGGSGGTGGMGSTSSSGGTGGSGMCKDGDVQPCYSGPAGTQNVGVCKAGQAVCKDGAWGACEGEVLPVAADDVCDGVDSDCDGDDDVTDGCMAFQVESDTCHGVILVRANAIVSEGSTPDTVMCSNGAIMWYLEPGDAIYVAEDDNVTTVTLWNVDPLSIGAKLLNGGAMFDYASMLPQYQSGGLDAAGLTTTTTVVPNGKEYKLDRTGNGKRGFALTF
jgi:hypothetical protein